MFIPAAGGPMEERWWRGSDGAGVTSRSGTASQASRQKEETAGNLGNHALELCGVGIACPALGGSTAPAAVHRTELGCRVSFPNQRASRWVFARQVFLDGGWATKIEAGPLLLAQKWKSLRQRKSCIPWSRTSIWQLYLLRLRFVFLLFNAKQEPGYVLGCFLHWPNKEGVHVFLYCCKLLGS